MGRQWMKSTRIVRHHWLRSPALFTCFAHANVARDTAFDRSLARSLACSLTHLLAHSLARSLACSITDHYATISYWHEMRSVNVQLRFKLLVDYIILRPFLELDTPGNCFLFFGFILLSSSARLNSLCLKAFLAQKYHRASSSGKYENAFCSIMKRKWRKTMFWVTSFVQ